MRVVSRTATTLDWIHLLRASFGRCAWLYASGALTLAPGKRLKEAMATRVFVEEIDASDFPALVAKLIQEGLDRFALPILPSHHPATRQVRGSEQLVLRSTYHLAGSSMAAAAGASPGPGCCRLFDFGPATSAERRVKLTLRPRARHSAADTLESTARGPAASFPRQPADCATGPAVGLPMS